MRKFHINIRRTCAIIIGVVFFVSGLLKLMDPVGTSLVVGEYFNFLHLSFLKPLSRGLAVSVPLVESFCGAALVAGIWRRVMSWIVLVMVGFFTLLTLVLWIFNPAMDCGCFGEMVHLTHFQSMIKNLFLLLMAVLAFVPIRTGMKPRPAKFVIFGIVALEILLFSIMSNIGIPVLDFTDYAPGAPLPERFSVVDEDAVRADSALRAGNIVVYSVYQPERLDFSEWARIADAIMVTGLEGLTPVLMVSSMDGVPMDLEEYALLADKRELMTLNRSNGGATLVSDGTVISKCALRRLPPEAFFRALRTEDPVELFLNNTVKGRLVLECTLIASLAALILI